MKFPIKQPGVHITREMLEEAMETFFRQGGRVDRLPDEVVVKNPLVRIMDAGFEPILPGKAAAGDYSLAKTATTKG